MHEENFLRHCCRCRSCRHPAFASLSGDCGHQEGRTSSHGSRLASRPRQEGRRHQAWSSPRLSKIKTKQNGPDHRGHFFIRVLYLGECSSAQPTSNAKALRAIPCSRRSAFTEDQAQLDRIPPRPHFGGCKPGFPPTAALPLRWKYAWLAWASSPVLIRQIFPSCLQRRPSPVKTEAQTLHNLLISREF